MNDHEVIQPFEEEVALANDTEALIDYLFNFSTIKVHCGKCKFTFLLLIYLDKFNANSS